MGMSNQELEAALKAMTAERDEQAKARAKAQEELEAVKEAQSTVITMKVAESGAISVYGMGRFPITLYPEQIQHFIADNSPFRAKAKAFVETETKAGHLAYGGNPPTNPLPNYLTKAQRDVKKAKAKADEEAKAKGQPPPSAAYQDVPMGTGTMTQGGK